MIRSMTGYGRAQVEGEHFAVTVEIRSVNNRFLKVSVRAPEVWERLSKNVETILKEQVTRGSISVTIRKVGTLGAAREYLVNAEAVTEYRRQLAQIEGGADVPLSELLALPGVVGAVDETVEELDEVWHRVEPVVREAADEMLTMRAREGENTREALLAVVARLRELTERVAEGAPGMVEHYRDRLVARVRELLQGSNVSINETDLARELAIFAERSDIREEIERMASHLKQFEALLDAEGSVGRQLEFLVQEMFRETNTMGSKSADASLAQVVLDAKADVDRLKEQVMNVE